MLEEYNRDVIVHSFNHSMWVYAPLNESFFRFSALPQGPKQSKSNQQIYNINYLNGQYADSVFMIDYDISQIAKYEASPGYESKYNEEFLTVQRNLMTSLYRAFGHFEQDPRDGRYYAPVEGDVTYLDPSKNSTHKEFVHSHMQTDRAPEIFVMVIADITHGLEITMLTTLPDIKRAHTDHNFMEEYQRRFVTDPLIGDQVIIQDTQGRHVDFHDVTWSEFLIKQMLHRIRNKYQHSAFLPSDDTRRELLTIAADTVGAYEFTGFNAVRLHDLAADSETSVTRDELAPYRQDSAPATQGRLIRLQFHP